MRYNSEPIRAHKAAVMMYLRGEGFHTAETRTGFCAVNRKGVCITVSPLRTLVEYKDPSGKIRCERFNSPQTVLWFQETVDAIEGESKNG